MCSTVGNKNWLTRDRINSFNLLSPVTSHGFIWSKSTKENCLWQRILTCILNEWTISKEFQTHLKKNTINTVRKLRITDLKCTNCLRRCRKTAYKSMWNVRGIVHLPFISAPRKFVTNTVTYAGKWKHWLAFDSP